MLELLGGLLTTLLTQEGAIFTMFASLVIWIMYTNDKRETRYIDTIDTLAGHVGELGTKVTKIEGDVNDIKNAIFKPKI